MTKINPAMRFDAIDVLRLQDDDAAQWLKESSSLSKPNSTSSCDPYLHMLASFSFARRRSKLVRQAVARYGSHIRSLKKLYRSGNSIEQLAVLSNPYIGPKDDFGLSNGILSQKEAEDISTNYGLNQRKFEVLVANPYLNRKWIASLIDKWKELKNEESNNKLLILVLHLTGNPIIRSIRDDTYMDGMLEYYYNKLNLSLVDLLQTVPVTPQWAYALDRLLGNLHLPYVPNFEVDLIERWKDPEPEEDSERSDFPALREQITRYLIVENHCPEVREKYSIEHHDAAVRKGLYCTLRPNELFEHFAQTTDFQYPSFRYLDTLQYSETQQEFVAFCKKCFERDKNEFVERLIWNKNFWQNKEEREFLSDIAWNLAKDPNSYMDVPNLYNAREKYHLKHNPSFFKDDEFISDSFESRAEKQLTEIQGIIVKMQEEEQRQITLSIEDLQSQISQIKKYVNDKTKYLGEVIQSKSEDEIRSLNNLNQKLLASINSCKNLILAVIIVIIVLWYAYLK